MTKFPVKISKGGGHFLPGGITNFAAICAQSFKYSLPWKPPLLIIIAQEIFEKLF